jgi:methylmalonyl-CoA mutase N-terminal domain/subunit
MPTLIDAVDAGATLGEICDVLRAVFGTHVARERVS